MSKTNPAGEAAFTIDLWHQITFDAISSGRGEFGLVPCRIGGETSACICTARETGQGIEIMPLFVAMTAGLDVTFPQRREGQGGGGGGRSATRPIPLAPSPSIRPRSPTADACGAAQQNQEVNSHDRPL